MNHVWLAILARDDCRESVGVRYVSHMWDVDPYWYFWFRDCPGVYRLELKNAVPLPEYDWTANFLVKYYPSITEKAFQGLSILEKLVRTSDVFDTRPSEGNESCPCHGSSHHHGEQFGDLADGCGVPDIRYHESIPPDFFFAGHLILAHLADRGSLVTTKSQSTWRVEMTQDHTIRDEDGNLLAHLKQDSIDRDFPGREITEFLHGRFTDGWKRFHNALEEKNSRWEQDGIVFKSDGRNLFPEASGQIRKIVLRSELVFHQGVQLVHPIDADINRIQETPRKEG
jgi:hypothetical protein